MNNRYLQEESSGDCELAGMLPSQYYAGVRNRERLDGERRLMFAVLADAVRCYLKGLDAQCRQQRLLFSEVQQWVNSSQESGPFAFAVLCDEFGINPAVMRQALAKRRGRGAANNGIAASRRSSPLASRHEQSPRQPTR
jgi:hypothetical protein